MGSLHQLKVSFEEALEPPKTIVGFWRLKRDSGHSEVFSEFGPYAEKVPRMRSGSLRLCKQLEILREPFQA